MCMLMGLSVFTVLFVIPLVIPQGLMHSIILEPESAQVSRLHCFSPHTTVVSCCRVNSVNSGPNLSNPVCLIIFESDINQNNISRSYLRLLQKEKMEL